MSVKVFVLGCPGTGKSTVVRHLLDLAEHNSYHATRMKDYHILLDMFQKETLQDKFRESQYGGFRVLDPSIYDMALKQLEIDVEEKEAHASSQEILTIEFARTNYRDAFHKFSPSFLENAYFFFLDAGVKTCIERIHNRLTVPPVSDCHFVPDEVVRAYDDTDNWSYVTQDFKKEFTLQKEVVFYSNTGTLDALYSEVERFANIIFTNEFSQPGQKDVTSPKELQVSLSQTSSVGEASFLPHPTEKAMAIL